MVLEYMEKIETKMITLLKKIQDQRPVREKGVLRGRLLASTEHSKKDKTFETRHHLLKKQMYLIGNV